VKILIISDSHGNIANLKHIMGFSKKFGVSAVIHAGDWNNVESIKTVLSFEIPLYTVLGNADIHNDLIKILKLECKKFGEDFLEFEIGGRKIGITHKPSNNQKYFSGENHDVIFNGHLHSKDESVAGAFKIIRPGAVINGNNFAVYDTATNGVEFIEDV
jgi:uncharacterized protein